MPKFLDVTDTAAARAALELAGPRVVTGAGIDLTGASDSSSAFQAILNAAAAAAVAGAGIVEVYIPPGTLALTTRPTVGAGVTIRGAGIGATTIQSSNTSGVLNLTGASDITIADMTIESTASGTSAIGIETTYTGLQSRVTITRCRITGATNNAARFPYAVEDLTFSDNLVEDCAAGFTHYAPTVASGLTSTGIRVLRNRFRNVGSTNIQIYGSTNALTVSTVIGVDISGNDLREFAQTGAAGPIPIEPTAVTNIRIANNTIEGPSTRGISTGSNVNMTITGNTIVDQSFYAIELNGGKQISIVGNTTENCASFALQTNDPAVTIDLADVVIANNTYNGSGKTSSHAASAIHIYTGQRILITGNVFTEWQYLRDAVRIGNGAAAIAKDCVVEGNTFVVADATTPVNAITVRTALRTRVTANAVRINRNLVAGDDYAAAILTVPDAASDDTLVDNNHVQFSGTIAAATYAHGVGTGISGVAACPGLTICRNHVANGPKGLFLNVNSADLVVFDNDTFTCASADVIPATAKANGPRYTSLLDTNGKTSIALTATANAVNYVTVRNRGTGGPPEIQSTGSDTDIGLSLVSKANGTIALLPGAMPGLQCRYMASAVNFLIIQGGATGSGVTLNASGTDTDVDMLLVTRGSGVVKANNNPVGVKVAVPASAGATGVPGQWAAESGWLYICVAANTWERVAIATW